MCLRCLRLFLILVFANPAYAADLRVCAEPDNLPFSHANQSGFENRIARLVAAELGQRLVYAWQPQRRGFARKTLAAGLCDLWIGVPSDLESVLPTKPYYRSTYVFVSRKGALVSFESENLRDLRVGVQLPGEDLASTPPGHALAVRGAVEKVVKKLKGDEATGAQAVWSALETPARLIATNAGSEGAVVVQQVEREEGSTGFNAATGEFEDLVKAGVIDPAKVTRAALQNAASIAAMILTTEVLVTDAPEPAAPMGGGMPGGGMGGMGGMGMM